MARGDEVRGEPRQVRLLGETWTLERRHPTLSATRADDGVPAAAVGERHGMVFLAPEPPVSGLLEVDVAGDPSFACGWLQPVRAKVGAGLMADNFLDVTHVPFLHAAMIGTGAQARPDDDLVVRREGLGLTVESQHGFAAHEGPGGPDGLRPPVQRRRVRYVYRAPFLLSRRIDHLDTGGTHVVVRYVQPEDEQSCRLYSAVYRNDLGPPGGPDTQRRLAEAVRYETLVLDEDLALQARYRDPRLPLDLHTEVHVEADRPTIELRRILTTLTGARSA